MRKHLLLSTAVVALCATLSGAALADVAATLSGSYASDTNGGGDNLWSANGSLTGHVDDNWGLEVTGGYHNTSDSGGNLDIWNAGGSVFWSGVQGRLAGTVNYYSTSQSGIGYHVTTYGGGGEWYSAPNLTVAVKGGGDTASASGFGFSGSDTGAYVGGMLEWYLVPDLALSGMVDYVDQSGVHVTSETAKLEWLFSETMPVSVYGGYQHADASSGAFGVSGDIFFVGLKFYVNGDGPTALVDRQRNGSLGYIAQAPVLGVPD
ncbi:MAG TPA: hypothetical protein VG843_05675 [Rhizomicrobium sp.]|jgi:hypothetical protein|nr:hypothetical protein [Rhizomicrobium sp.]